MANHLAYGHAGPSRGAVLEEGRTSHVSREDHLIPIHHSAEPSWDRERVQFFDSSRAMAGCRPSLYGIVEMKLASVSLQVSTVWRAYSKTRQLYDFATARQCHELRLFFANLASTTKAQIICEVGPTCQASSTPQFRRHCWQTQI